MTPDNVHASYTDIIDSYNVTQSPEDLNTFSGTNQNENINVYHPVYYYQTLPPAMQVPQH